MLLSVASLTQLGAIVAQVEWVRWRYTGKRAGGPVGSLLTGESVRVAPLMTWVCVSWVLATDEGGWQLGHNEFSIPELLPVFYS